ncbi:hypothetical protein TNCV_1041021 [Trichonephila clavipes]|nr:hypothetical protein TNCV_1041021 [Trichonephila clavipes]
MPAVCDCEETSVMTLRYFPGVPSSEKYRIQVSPIPACGINDDLFACRESISDVEMCAQCVINPDYIEVGTLELIGRKGEANPEVTVREMILLRR